ncbi:MAG: hypothetical protein EOO14_13830 [Chitinophagaceae bacterium]|nr:MAG: hypothetical protein EOO14_13830 [Chitinophagaceae bacterium]
MDGDRKSNIDWTEEASKEGTSEPASVSGQAGNDELFEGPGFAATPSPEEDSVGENRVTTSISED